MRYEDEFPDPRKQKESQQSLEPARPRNRLRFSSQLMIGAVIAVFGIAILLDNLDVIDSSRDILRYWPALLVIFGLRDLVVATDGSHALRGTLLVAFGVLLLLNTLDIFDFSIIGLWPLFLILFGVQMVVRAVSAPDVAAGDSDTDQSVFDDFAVLGGVKRSIGSSAFRGGSASALMGGVDVDLTKAQLAGDSAVINVFALMGGVVLRVPQDWAVASNVTALMGGVDDKRRPPVDPVGTLILEGSVVMGGIEIKD